MIELQAGEATVAVNAVQGGRIAQITIGNRPILIDDPGHGPMGWGCYPMAPWAGRVRRGRFVFDDRPYQLPINLEPHAIHGTCFDQAWTLIDQGPDHVDLHRPLSWPFGGVAQQHLQLEPDALLCLLTVLATDQPMPATIGWHPWFVKPDRVEVSFAAMYARDAEHIPTGQLVEPSPPPWDDCFVGPAHLPRLHYDGLTVTVSSDCDHWVVYDMPAHATCIEPQSGPPDAFNLGSATRLEPGEMLQRVMTIRWN